MNHFVTLITYFYESTHFQLGLSGYITYFKRLTLEISGKYHEIFDGKCLCMWKCRTSLFKRQHIQFRALWGGLAVKIPKETYILCLLRLLSLIFQNNMNVDLTFWIFVRNTKAIFFDKYDIYEKLYKIKLYYFDKYNVYEKMIVDFLPFSNISGILFSTYKKAINHF